MTITVKHKKGKHYCNLSSLLKIVYASLFLSNKDIYLEFDENAKYYLDEDDYSDWNKVIGRGSLKYKNGSRESEEFITWRYLRDTNEFQVTNTYKRVDYRMVTPTEWQSIFDGGMMKTNMRSFKSLLPIGGYFGGNDTDGNGIGGVAPKNLQYKIIIR